MNLASDWPRTQSDSADGITAELANQPTGIY
jgi:hypothetical protein